jgi:hypothetical protein
MKKISLVVLPHIGTKVLLPNFRKKFELKTKKKNCLLCLVTAYGQGKGSWYTDETEGWLAILT